MTTLPTKAAVDRAQPLDFPDRKPAADLLIAIKARVDGFDCDITYTGSIEGLLKVTARLRELGAEPTIAPAPASKKSTKVQPEYLPDGTPICPTHRKPLREGSYGLHCTAKDPAGKNGYCDLKFDA